jgi:hypothetical protein
MGVELTLKYLTELSPGRYEYRRRVPESVKAALGKNEFKRVIEAVKPAELAKGYARVEAEFQMAVAGAAARGSGSVATEPSQAPSPHLCYRLVRSDCSCAGRMIESTRCGRYSTR